MGGSELISKFAGTKAVHVRAKISTLHPYEKFRPIVLFQLSLFIPD